MAVNIVTAARRRPRAYIVHGTEGIGKTSFGAFTPNPIFIQTQGEAGLETLIDAGQLPEIAHFDSECETFEQLQAQVAWLLTEKHNHKTLVIDTLGGVETLLHDLVVKRDYGGDRGEKGFMSYQKGYRLAIADWRELLNTFDALRDKRGMTIMGICHTAKRTFRNPEGPDYDRFEPRFEARETWETTFKWADCVLFLNYYTKVELPGPDKKATKGKATGGQMRIMYTQRHAAFDAKNRLGLPEEIDCGDSPKETWDNFVAALTEAKKKEV